MTSRLDIFYRKVIPTKFFTKGWGPPDGLHKLIKFHKDISSQKHGCYKLVPKEYPIKFTSHKINTDCEIIEGKFISPASPYLPTSTPEVVHTAYFQLILPVNWTNKMKPICIHLAGTGDHHFWRRRNTMARPLLNYGIGSIILENPYYGLRKPRSQLRSSLHYVSDIFIMGSCLILECIALLNWCELQGYGPLGVSGVSMGGHMASLVACHWPKALVLVPCLSWSTASSAFTDGVMSESINWDLLQNQFLSDYLCNGSLSKLCKIVDKPPLCIDQTIEQNKNHQKFFNNILQKSRILTKSQIRNMKIRDKEALRFMRIVMDEFTHLKNFPPPLDTSLIIAVCAKSDGYVPRTGVTNLKDLWPEATIKYIDTGHVGACLWHQKVFRMSIVEAFQKAKHKQYCKIKNFDK